jgi:hypothetical protein
MKRVSFVGFIGSASLTGQSWPKDDRRMTFFTPLDSLPTGRTDPVGSWRRVQKILVRRKTDGQKGQRLAAYPVAQGKEDISGLSEAAVLFRLRGDPSMSLISVSENVEMYGYDARAMTAALSCRSGASRWPITPPSAAWRPPRFQKTGVSVPFTIHQ